MRWWLNVGRPIKNQAVGIALGMPISPLWANIYLHELDWRLVRNRWALVRYADDFVVLTDSAAAAERVHALVADTLAGLQLRLEPSKSRVSSFSDGFEFLGVHFQGNEFNPCQRTTGARPLQVCQCTCEQLTGRCLYCRRMAVGGSTSERVSPAKPSSTGLPCADSPWPGCPARASRRWPCWRYRWPVRLSSARTPYQSPGCTGARSLCSNG